MSLAQVLLPGSWPDWWHLTLAPSQPWLPLAVALALDTAGLCVALWATAVHRHLPGRVRWLAGMGLLLVAVAPLTLDALVLARTQWAAAVNPESVGDLGILLRWGGGIAGLLALALGLGWATTRRASQRALAVLAALGALLVVAAGGIIAWLAEAGKLPASWTPATSIPAFSVLLAGAALALLGAAGTVAAVALGRTAGAGSRGMRARLAGAALLYAVCVVGGPWLVAVPLGAGSATSLPPDAAPPIVAALALVGLVALVLTTRRLLTRTAAASGVYTLPTHPAHARGRAAPAGSAHPATRIAATVPAVPRGGESAPALVGPAAWLTPPAAAPSIAFTPPALRHSVFVERPATATAGYEAPHLIHLPHPSAPPVPPPAAAQPGAAAMPVAAANPAPDNPLPRGNERRDLSPQFIASVAHLQAELARAGHEYTFEELLDAFDAVAPRTR